jgi:membrane dipeptidase
VDKAKALKRSRTFAVAALLVLTIFVAFFSLVPGIVERQSNKVALSTKAISKKAKALHKNLFVVDLHGDSLLWQRDIVSRSTQGHIDLPRLEEGNVALQVFASVTKTPKGQN